MRPSSSLPVLVLLVVTAPTPGVAQFPTQITTPVTIRVPVILTNLPAEVKAVKVTCSITSDALVTGNATYPNQVSKDEDITVLAGEVVKVVTMTFSVTLKSDAGGKAAGAACLIRGWDTSTSSWVYFNEGALNPWFRTKPSVFPSQSSFTW